MPSAAAVELIADNDAKRQMVMWGLGLFIYNDPVVGFGVDGGYRLERVWVASNGRTFCETTLTLSA